MTATEINPVVIIGAGPAGMTLAHVLHRHNVPCVVFDRNTKQHIYETGRAGLFDHTSAMIVDQYGLSDRIHSEEWTKAPVGPHRSCYFTRVEEDGKKTVIDWSPVKIIQHDLQQRKGQDAKDVMDMYNPLYPQTELVLDMQNKAEEVGIEIKYGMHVSSISDAWKTKSNEPIEVTYHPKEGDDVNDVKTIVASYVIGCGGYNDPVRSSMKEKASDEFVEAEVEWGPITLGIFSDSIPSTEKIIYGYHPDGMAAHMIRTESKSRYYLEVDATEAQDEDNCEDGVCTLEYDDETKYHNKIKQLEKIWNEETIWKALTKRLGIPDLDHGPITSMQFFRTQHFVVETMSIGRAAVAGDAAHSRPYLGARGANNSVQDGYVLGEILVKAFRDSKNGGVDFTSADLSSYSQQRVPCIWESARFTYEFYRMCFGKQGTNGKDAFQQAMVVPLFERIKATVDQLDKCSCDDVDIDLLTYWFSYCYCNPCVKPKSVDEWINIKPAGFGVRKIKK